MTKLPNCENVLGPRASGLLLHPSSLPGNYGIGDLGPSARQFVDTLAKAYQRWWQMLPLGPPGPGNSPYQCFSAFAGNTLLISPDDLLDDGLLERKHLRSLTFTDGRVDYERVRPCKAHLLTLAWQRFSRPQGAGLADEFAHFCRQQADWLNDYALFVTLLDAHGQRPWQQWDTAFARRKATALKVFADNHRDAIDREKFSQFLFFRQYGALRQYAVKRGVQIIGDLPLFVSGNSVDVWTRPELFQLRPDGQPTVVAGVPPDAFSATGQLWGNPLYRWRAMKRDRYAWWTDRLRATFAQCDLARIDHFRGLAACWETPTAAADARSGKWKKAPGREMLEEWRKRLGALPVIAEDLGLITPDVEELRDRFSLPGMRVLQFAFGGGAQNPHIPYNHIPNVVAYTGTHDNNTTRGWYHGLPPELRTEVDAYTGRRSESIARAIIRSTWQSVARLAIAPVQDLLNLGDSARMNMPGTENENWCWRLGVAKIPTETIEWLGQLTKAAGRCT